MYKANPERYENMKYSPCGHSGLKLPLISLGLWYNFGYNANREQAAKLVTTAFDRGITHFDLANNYGPPPGSAEELFGQILKDELAAYRDELIVSTKAGFYMWPGPYGDGGSRKYLISSLDQSLKRLGLEYVDIYYHHRPDVNTPVEETMQALLDIQRSGKALYVGVSNYNAGQLEEASAAMKKLGGRLTILQPVYNMFNRAQEETIKVRLQEGIGAIAYSPLAQGLLTDRYLNGVPEDSRAGKGAAFLKAKDITPERVETLKQLNQAAQERGQTLAEMALAWDLKQGQLTSVLIGASKPEQIEQNIGSLDKLSFTPDELSRIDAILAG